jgi:protein O-mannosyl-transferase
MTTDALDSRPHRHGQFGAVLGSWRAWLIGLLVAGAVAAAFWSILDNPFLNWDDKENFLENPYYRGLGWRQIWWAWTGVRIGVYQPLSWMLLEAQYVVWGLDPWGYHLVSLLLHALTSVSLYFVIVMLLRQAGSRSRLASAWDGPLSAGLAVLIFAVHPLRTEVVAWASCQPYLPCALFYVLSVAAYLHAQDPLVTNRRPWQMIAFVCFLAALLSKAVAVSLPFVLVILDWYPLRRFGAGSRLSFREFRRIVVEKMPYLVAATAFMIVAAAVKPHAPITTAPPWFYLGRVTEAAYATLFYLGKTFVPTDIRAFYAYPLDVHPFSWPFLASFGAVMAISALAVRVRGRAPAVLAAWLSYLVIAGPNLGLIQISRQFAADRYSYVSHMGLVALAAGALFSLFARLRPAVSTTIAILIAGAVSVWLLPMTWKQNATWGSSETLWAHALVSGGERVPEIRNHLAVTLADADRMQEAEGHLREAVRLNPKSGDANQNLGAMLARQGRFSDAEAYFREAIRLSPRHAEAKVNLGTVLVRQGRVEEALREYVHALELDPDCGAQAKMRSLLIGGFRIDDRLRPLIWNVVDAPGDRTALAALRAALERK